MSESPYDASHIEVLEGLVAIRKRPGMYIGSTTESGLHRLVDELVGHAIDEAAGGRAGTVGVTLTADGGVRVADDGRGIPAEDIETALTELRAGSFSVVGICLVNALSRRVEVEVRRDGFRWTQQHERGVPLAPPRRHEQTPDTGTTITFWPDPEIFGTTECSSAALSDRFRELAALGEPVTLTLTDERPPRAGRLA
ncbi:ATP-binding protein [Streptomyces sp. NPDC051704]|uniref:ATP-binding protein n=1 Tax=Streptomyces sp. NPDC051704 TaxID=3365671 RepID=UPI003792BAE5